ncbi:MAG: NAD(P)H-binding protein [Myxococcota bacterium]
MTTRQLLLLGANGRTGRLVLAGALSAGHRVTAVVRGADRLRGVDHARLEVRVGDACDPAFLRAVAPGHDALVSTLGPRRPTRAAAAVYVASGEAIAAAAPEAALERVLVTSSALLFPTSEWTTRALQTLVRPLVDGARAMEERVRACDLGWTVARTGFLTDGADEGLRVGVESLPERPRAVSRAAVAGFLLEELSAGRHERQTVGLCA